jgi:hypothetical protein
VLDQTAIKLRFKTLQLSPWFHNHTLANYICAIAGGGKLADGEAWPVEVNMRPWSAIELTTSSLVALVCTHCGSGSGEASDREDQHASMGATIGCRDELGGVGLLRELAKVRARGGCGNGGSARGSAHAGSCDGGYL